MRERFRVLLGLILGLVLLSGCSFRSGDDLYALPKTSDEYNSLHSSIQTLLDSGLEYAAPLSGSNTQQVQAVDLDADGTSEVVAFFRSSTGLQVSIFWQNNEGEYQEMTTITGQGSAINSVAYAQLDGEGNREIVLTWQISSGVYALSAYSVAPGGSVELLSPRNYSRFSVVDLNRDGQEELILLQLDASDAGNNRAEYYSWLDGGLVKQGEALLSDDMTVIDHLRISDLADRQSALYITGFAADGGEGNNSRTQLTDILTLRDGMLVNVTWNESAQSSISTRRRLFVADQDLNGDGVWDIPIISSLYERLESGEVVLSDTVCLVTWIDFDAQGERRSICSTYYNSSDGWYLDIPEQWHNQVALTRQESTIGAATERSIAFYALSNEEPGSRLEESGGRTVLTNTRSELFMTIYKITGADRLRRAGLEGRTSLEMDTPEACYCVTLSGESPDDWTIQNVKKNLHIITTDWSSE